MYIFVALIFLEIYFVVDVDIQYKNIYIKEMSNIPLQIWPLEAR